MSELKESDMELKRFLEKESLMTLIVLRKQAKDVDDEMTLRVIDSIFKDIASISNETQ